MLFLSTTVNSNEKKLFTIREDGYIFKTSVGRAWGKNPEKTVYTSALLWIKMEIQLLYQENSTLVGFII